MFDPGLKIGEVIDNNQLRSIFKCGIMGGMRRSYETNTLVLVSDHTKGLYDDHWEGDILYYTGMGKVGHQSLLRGQNKTLRESSTNGVEVFLFEVFRPTEYIYLGQVELTGWVDRDQQPDENGDMRFVYIFPIKPKSSGEIAAISSDLTELYYREKQKKARRLSLKELKDRALLAGKTKNNRRSSNTVIYERNAYISEYVKRMAKGECQLCKQQAPFKDSKGVPYLESHHIVWLSKGGEDTIENSVALCPNCHRKMHVLDLNEDIDKLQKDGK